MFGLKAIEKMIGIGPELMGERISITYHAKVIGLVSMRVLFYFFSRVLTK